MSNLGKAQPPCASATIARLSSAFCATPAALALAWAQPVHADAFDTAAEQMRTIASAAEANDCRTVLKVGSALLAGKGLAGFPVRLRSSALTIVAGCEVLSGAADKGYAHLLQATAIEESPAEAWGARFALEVDSGWDDKAVNTIEAMNQGHGAALNAMESGWLYELHHRLHDAGKEELRRRLLAVLASDGYAPEDNLGEHDYFRLAYVPLLIQAGDRDAARAQLLALTDPAELVDASLDLRLRPLLPDGLDVRAATERGLARRKDAMGLHPDQLSPLLLTTEYLRMLGRSEEALTLLQAAAPRLDSPQAFTDRAEKLNWWWDELGRNYAALGRYDEAVDAFRKGAATGEGGRSNISQVINLAETQISFGRPDEALKTLSGFGGTGLSPYGAMEFRFARGCAQALAGRPADAAGDLAFASEHWKDDGEALRNLLLCTGDMDGAAAAAIRSLDDPDQRVAALKQLSDYDDPPVARAADPLAPGIKALKARADVQAAIARAGGIRRFRIQAFGL